MAKTGSDIWEKWAILHTFCFSGVRLARTALIVTCAMRRSTPQRRSRACKNDPFLPYVGPRFCHISRVNSPPKEEDAKSNKHRFRKGFEVIPSDSTQQRRSRAWMKKNRKTRKKRKNRKRRKREKKRKRKERERRDRPHPVCKSRQVS